MRSLRSEPDANGRDTDAIDAPDYVCTVFLQPDVPKLLPVPAGARIVNFGGIADFWVRFGGPVTRPTADVLDGTSPEYCPLSRVVTGVAEIGIVSQYSGFVNIIFFR